jgi:hypothetical protein
LIAIRGPNECSNQQQRKGFRSPLRNLGHDKDGKVVKEGAKLIGTCFLIGSRGYALTAAHVLKQSEKDIARVLFPDPEGWDACLIRTGEVHPTEDVGILKIDLPRPIVSPVLFASKEPLPSLEYNMWAYPEIIAREIEFHERPPDALDFNPSPVYFRGYIRRKLPYSPNPSFDIYIGKHFYEVSEIGGACCSGAPLSTIATPLDATPPGVFAIYIGEEQEQRRCGYAMNLMRVLDWIPESLGKPIRDEVVNVGP